MNKEDFETEHPSLKGKVDIYTITARLPLSKEYFNQAGQWIDIRLDVFHETQIDKKIVEMAIESNLSPSINKQELLEELGLNTKNTENVEKGK